MQDRDLYAQILGIQEPWRVEGVDLDLKAGEVIIRLTRDASAEWPCAECGRTGGLYDHQPKRRWRHLDTCQLQTILEAEPPRSNCPDHGVRTVKLPWAEPGSRFTVAVGKQDSRRSATLIRKYHVTGTAEATGHGIVQFGVVGTRVD